MSINIKISVHLLEGFLCKGRDLSDVVLLVHLHAFSAVAREEKGDDDSAQVYIY